MVRGPTETGDISRSIELQEAELALREDTTAERQPIGSTDEGVRCAAFTIRNARSLPVHPGCDIRLVLPTMRVRMSPRSWAG